MKTNLLSVDVNVGFVLHRAEVEGQGGQCLAVTSVRQG